MNTLQSYLLCLLAACPLLAIAQLPNLIYLEAEAGNPGADYALESEDGLTFARINSNGIATHPEREARTITWEVNFTTNGHYDLYLRCRVGPDGFDDDSFFYGNGFGAKVPGNPEDWIRVNGIANRGYANPIELVDGQGNAGTNVWKWINLSEFTGDEEPAIFQAEANQTYTFQIGAREDGLDIDKLLLAPANELFSVATLNTGELNTPDSGTEAIATGQPKFLGNIYSSSQLPDFTRYWNQVTPENAGKWGSVERNRDIMDWTQLDAAYQLAKNNGFPFRFHVLVWGNQQPAWIENLSPDEQLTEIQEWFDAVATRYPDIDVIEVVNEPLHDPPNSAGNGGGNYLAALGGTGATGWDWVLNAFRMARNSFPNTQLMINDYNILGSSTNTNRYKALIELLQNENLIDEIGVQGHAFSTRGSTAVMQFNLDRLAETGLPITVTEMDIDGPSDNIQLADYQRIFPTLWEHPAVKGITLWGYRPGMWRTEQMAYLINNDGSTERPALQWLRSYVEQGQVISNTRTRQAAETLTIFPNPVTSGQAIELQLPTSQTWQISIYNLQGLLVSRKTQFQNNPLLISSDLPKGSYLIQAVSAGKYYLGKMIIQ